MDSHDAIYLIDCDPVSSQSIERTLRDNGYSVQKFASSGDFMDGFSIADVGCVVANMHSSADQGIVIQKELIWRGSDLTIVSLVSSNGKVPPDRVVAKHSAIMTLQIPFTDSELIACVREGIAKSEERKANRDRLEGFQRRLSELTESEVKVLKCLMKGMSHKNVSVQLSLSSRSVDRRRKSILEKMHVSTLQELISTLAETQIGN